MAIYTAFGILPKRPGYDLPLTLKQLPIGIQAKANQYNMMKYVLSGLLALGFFIEASACDICHVYLGLRPQDYRHNVGIQFRHRVLQGSFPVASFGAPKKLGSPKHLDEVQDLVGPEDRSVRESYSVIELRAQYFLSPEWVLTGNLPVIRNESILDNERVLYSSGVGDAWVMIARQIFATKSTETESAFSHRLRLGSGVKFPLGKTKEMFDNESVPYDMQPGSGSYDILGTLEYMIRYGKVGLSSNAVYKQNTENLSGYRFGNTVLMSAQFFGLIQWSEFYLMPSVGYYHEIAGKDSNDGEIIQTTGGSVSFAGAEIEAGNNTLSARFGAQLSLHDHLLNSNVPARFRLVAGIRAYIK